MSDNFDIVQRDDTVYLETGKNRFKWDWLEEKVEVKDKGGQVLFSDFLSDFVRKVKKTGSAKCIWCSCEINYLSTGKKSLHDHAKTLKHKKSRDAYKNQQELPSAFQLLSKLNILSGGDGGGGGGSLSGHSGDR